MISLIINRRRAKPAGAADRTPLERQMVSTGLPSASITRRLLAEERPVRCLAQISNCMRTWIWHVLRQCLRLALSALHVLAARYRRGADCRNSVRQRRRAPRREQPPPGSCIPWLPRLSRRFGPYLDRVWTLWKHSWSAADGGEVCESLIPRSSEWWARQNSNLRPLPCQGSALTN